MYSSLIEETSQPCFNGCCSSPFLALTSSPKPYQLEFSVTTAASFLNQNTKFTNHESLPSLQKSFLDFITTFPDYLQTDRADHIRSSEYENLSSTHHVSLNHIGHALFSYSQYLQLQRNRGQSSEPESESVSPGSSFFALSHKSVRSGAELLSSGSQESEFQSRMRKRIMDFMNLEESDYHMVLTLDRSSAFKILAELYPFLSNPNLLTVYDHEDKAVEAMIGISKKRGGRHESAEFLWPNMEIRLGKLQKKVMRRMGRGKERGLFVFPLQSQVTGAQYSYSWMSLAQENGWHVLLDASALGSKDTETLGLSLFNPDFLICSFVEVLGQNGLPGFTCLFIKKSSASVLSESDCDLNQENLVILTAEPARMISRASGSNRWSMFFPPDNNENTPEFSRTGQDRSLDHNASSCSEIVELEPSIQHCQSSNGDQILEFRALDHADSLGLILIRSRTFYLTKWLIQALMSLQHPSSETGIPLVRIYETRTRTSRGPSISFNIFDWQDEKIDPLLVQRLAERNKIKLGFGYLQNIRLGHRRRRRNGVAVVAGEAKDEKGKILGTKLSVVTIRLGFLTNFEDIFRVWVFVSRFLDADFVEKEKWRSKALKENK